MGGGASALSEGQKKEVAALIHEKHVNVLLTAFRKYDRKGDGLVSRSEFFSAIAELGIKVPGTEIDQLIMQAQSDQGGMVKYRMVVSYVKNAGEGRRAQFQANLPARQVRKQKAYVHAHNKLRAKLKSQQRDLHNMQDKLFQRKKKDGHQASSSTSEPVTAEAPKMIGGLPVEEAGKYTKLKTLGKGTFGRVYLVRCIDDTKLYAMKQVVGVGPAISMTSEKAHPELVQALKEVEVMRRINHPNIVQFKEAFISLRGNLSIVMAYCEGGDLSDVIKTCKQRGERLREARLLRIVVQTLLALQFMHSKKVYHRDLKPQNVLLASRDLVKLADFGLSKVMEHTNAICHTQVGTPYYMSPEICKNVAYDSGSDVWSLGCLVFELMELRVPFKGKTLVELMRDVLKTTPELTYNSKSTSVADQIFSGAGGGQGQYSDGLASMTMSMLEKEPEKRPGAAELLTTPPMRRAMQDFVSQYSKANAKPAAAPAAEEAKGEEAKEVEGVVEEEEQVEEQEEIDVDIDAPAAVLLQSLGIGAGAFGGAKDIADEDATLDKPPEEKTAEKEEGGEDEDEEGENELAGVQAALPGARYGDKGAAAKEGGGGGGDGGGEIDEQDEQQRKAVQEEERRVKFQLKAVLKTSMVLHRMETAAECGEELEAMADDWQGRAE
jgi:NIMA (never in mitosis gene a)-related kinase